jgi:drug/metabolite transporter (DMT)-like permease
VEIVDGKPMLPLSKTLQAIILMLLSMACFATMNVVIRLVADTMHPTQIVLLRNILSFALVVAWTMMLHQGMPRVSTRRLKGHFWRASIGFVAMETWFYSITIMPLTVATALSFTTPIFSTIFAILFLREQAGVRRWAAIACGFVGILVILRPDVNAVGGPAALVLFSSAIMAVAGVLVKTLTRTESPETIVFYMALFMIPWSLFPALPHLSSVDAYQFWLIFLIALFSTAAHLMMTRAFKRVDMVVLMPFDFTRLVFTAILAYLVFGEVMDDNTVLGALIIVASTVYIAHRETRAKKEAVMPPGD